MLKKRVFISSVFILLLNGCVNNHTSNEVSATYTPDTDFNLLYEQVELFYQRYPEYLNSEKKDSQLYNEFEKIKMSEKYKNLSLYELLVKAHTNLFNSKR